MWSYVKLAFCTVPYLVFAVDFAMFCLAVRGTRVRRGVKPAVALVGLVGAMKFTGFRLLGGNAFNPELPVWLLFSWGWLESVLWIALPLGVLTALVYRCCRGTFGFRKPHGKTLAWSVIALSAVLALYGMHGGIGLPEIRERELVFEDLPYEFDGYRLVHVSDLHCSAAARRDKIAGTVELINSCRPDLVAITGDFVDGSPDQRKDDLEPLRDIRAQDGVWACTGNHEHYWNLDEWMPYYTRWNIGFLRGSWKEIRRGRGTVVIGGTDDPVFSSRPAAAFRGAPEDAFRILLLHRPIWCEWNAAQEHVRLQLSGHTHGGAMPLVDRLVARFNDGHVGGLYRVGQLTLHVSPGSGQWAGFPLRFFNPSEITLLILRRR